MAFSNFLRAGNEFHLQPGTTTNCVRPRQHKTWYAAGGKCATTPCLQILWFLSVGLVPTAI